MCLSDHAITSDYPPVRWQECGAAYLFRVMRPADVQTLGGWLASDMSVEDIATFIQREYPGIDVGAQSLRRHRRGSCKC